jgi:hypothetical protein
MPLAAEQESGIMADGVWCFTWTPFGVGTEVRHRDGSTHAASVKLEHAGSKACSLVEEMVARLRCLRKSHDMQIIHCRRARRGTMVRWLKDVSRREVDGVHREANHVVVAEGVPCTVPIRMIFHAIIPIFAKSCKEMMRGTIGARPTQHAEPIC